MGKCRIQNIVPPCGYRVEGIDLIRLLDFADFADFKFEGDALYSNCRVTAIFRSGGFVDIAAPETAKYTSSLQNGTYTHVLETFIGDITAELEARLHLATKRRYVVLFRTKNGRYYAFAYEAGATVIYANQTAGDLGAVATITAMSVYPLFEVSEDAFNDKNAYRATWVTDYEHYATCEVSGGSNTGNQLATVLFRVSEPGGIALDKNNNTAIPPVKQAIAVLSGESNPDPNNYETVGEYSPREIVGGTDTHRYNTSSCPVAVDVTVIFFGNGGKTADGRTSIPVVVREGTLWKDVPKPEFLQSGTAKKQNGFTFDAGDDNTLIPTDYIVDRDIEVYASYTAIETGVITAAGEIMSVQQWIEKYGDNCIEVVVSSNRIKESMRNNLVLAAYFKVGDSAFGIFPATKDNAGNYIGTAPDGYVGGNGLDLSAYLPEENSRFVDEYPSKPGPRKFPGLFIPPDWDLNQNRGVPQQVLDRVMSYSDGQALCNSHWQACQGRTDGLGVTGSPALDNLRGIVAGEAIRSGDVYIPSPFQYNLIKNNIQKLIDIQNGLNAWSISFGQRHGTNTNQQLFVYVPPLMEHSGAGFTYAINALDGNTTTYYTVFVQAIQGKYNENQVVTQTGYCFPFYDMRSNQIAVSNEGNGIAQDYRYYSTGVMVCNLAHLF